MMTAVLTGSSVLASSAPARLGALVLQRGVDVPVRTPLFNVVGGAVGAFLTTLVVGAILIAVAPAYTERRMADLVAEPVGSFVYGVVALLALGFVILLLFITIVGILVAAPLALLAWAIWAVGSVVAFLVVADRIVGHEDGWLVPLLVGAGINGLLTLTGVGGILSFCLGAAGFGAVLRSLLS